MKVMGYVYVLKNEHIMLVKIGFTNRNPDERADELSNFTGVPGKWRVCKSWMLADAYQWEQSIFKELSRYRRDGEFFQLTPEKAIELITLYLLNENAINSDGLTAEEVEEIRKKNVEFDIRLKRQRAKKKWESIENELSKKAESEAENFYGMTVSQTYAEEKKSRTVLDAAKDLALVLTIPLWALPTMAYKALFTDGKPDYKGDTNQYVLLRGKIFEKQRELLDQYKKSFIREHGDWLDESQEGLQHGNQIKVTNDGYVGLKPTSPDANTYITVDNVGVQVRVAEASRETPERAYVKAQAPFNETVQVAQFTKSVVCHVCRHVMIVDMLEREVLCSNCQQNITVH
jgi:hypothetical protein